MREPAETTHGLFLRDALDDANRPRLAIVTALPIESEALRKLLFDEKLVVDCDGRPHFLGRLEGANGIHRIVLHQAGVGNNNATHAATRLRFVFPSIQVILMVGIAGAIPRKQAPRSVRLGDVVVSGEDGVIQYDRGSDEEGDFKHSHPPRPPSQVLLSSVQRLEAKWNPFHLSDDGGGRPDPKTDVLQGPDGKRVRHPVDATRDPAKPRIVIGAIGSGNVVLKNRDRREQLAAEFKALRAIEMESSGVADAARICGLDYFSIRGTCDYCDTLKTKEWQPYAAQIAALFARALLVETELF